MIHTRFGTEVRIVAANIHTGEVDVRAVADDRFMQTYDFELRADGGRKEILEEMERVVREGNEL
jgi:hypothetical protein